MSPDDKRSWLQKAQEDDYSVNFCGLVVMLVGAFLVESGMRDQFLPATILGGVLIAAGWLALYAPARPPKR